MLTIYAIIRNYQGKSVSRRMRRANKLPAIIYGGTENPIAIELDHNLVINAQIKENFYRDVITLIIDGKEIKVKVQEVQRHPFKPKITHIDFVRA